MDQVTLSIIAGPDYVRDEDGWVHHAYTVKLNYQGRTMQTPWRQGLGIAEDPNAHNVLENLFIDAIAYDSVRNFEDWAAEYGYDSDSRKAEKLYRDVGDQTRKFRCLLGLGTNPWPLIGEDAETLARQYTE